jgi:large subunit ribosomal protein L16
MFEMSGVDEAVAKEAMRLASHKLPIHTRFMIKEADGSIKSLMRELVTVET